MTSNNVLLYDDWHHTTREVWWSTSPRRGRLNTELWRKLSYTIANRMEWLWSPSDSLNICFCGAWRCTTYNSVPIILILLTNKNVALIYYVTICEQRTKDCAPSGSFQHKVKHCCFYLRCLPSFITSPLYYGFKYRCFSHLPGDAPMRGSWTFQIKQMVTDVMN